MLILIVIVVVIIIVIYFINKKQRAKIEKSIDDNTLYLGDGGNSAELFVNVKDSTISYLYSLSEELTTLQQDFKYDIQGDEVLVRLITDKEVKLRKGEAGFQKDNLYTVKDGIIVNELNKTDGQIKKLIEPELKWHKLKNKEWSDFILKRVKESKK